MSSINCFPPISDKLSKVLILGSMPGTASLKMNSYYAHSQNKFWSIIYALFEKLPEGDYMKRTAFIREKGIALWDVLESCSRKGSLDSDIRKPEPNNFHNFFKQHANIRAVFFNGAKAFELFEKRVGFTMLEGKEYHRLPSTSPANNGINFQKKLQLWSGILQYL